jgi:hypothetical protein
MMAHADAGRLFARMPVVMREIAEPGDDGIEHRDIDQLSLAGLFALIKRQQMPMAAYMPEAISAIAMPARPVCRDSRWWR